MVKNTALNKLMSGSKVRAFKWEEGKFICINKDGQIVDNNGNTFNMMTSKETKWELFKEPVASAGGTDNKEVIQLIKDLTKRVDTLQESLDSKAAPAVDIDSYEIADEVKSAIGGEIKEAIEQNMPQEEKTHEETVKIFYGVSKLNEVRELFKAELLNCNERKDVLTTVTKYIPFCWMGGRKIKTVARYYTDMRNVIKDVGDQYEDLALDLFSIPTDVYERIKKADTKKVLEKLDNQETFDEESIRSMIDRLRSQIELSMELGEDATADDFKENGLPIAKQQTADRARAYLYSTYLAFVTGRRNAEILKTLELVKKNDGWYYKGINKKGVEGQEIKAVSLEEDFDFLVKVLDQVRKDLDTTKMKNTEVNSKFNHIFNKAFKKITETTYTFHDAREIFAELAYLDFGKIKGTEREEIDYKSDALGHEVDKERLVSTEHYMTMKKSEK